MPGRPIELARWAHDPADPDPVTGDVRDPGEAKRALGWYAQERPPAQYQNFLMNRVGEWIEHLRYVQVKNWMKRTMVGGATRFNGVAVSEADRIVVAVGFDGADAVINSSKQGQIYVDRAPASGAGDEYHACIFVAGSINLFVLSDDNGDYESSPDGTTWTQRAGADANQKNAICFREVDSALLVAVGNAGQVETSTNGTAWTDRTMAVTAKVQNDVAHNQIAGGSGLFVSVGEDGDVHTSPDGITWTKRTGPAGGADGFDGKDIRAVVYDAAAQLWVISVLTGTGGSIYYTSGNGTTWTAAASSTREVESLATDRKGMVVGVGSKTTDDLTGVWVTRDAFATVEECSMNWGKRYKSVRYSAALGWFIVGIDDGTAGLLLQSVVL